MKNENEILESNLEKLMKGALSPHLQEGKKAVFYQKLVMVQQKKNQIGEFPLPVLLIAACMLGLLSMFLILLFLSSGLSSTLLPGFWLAFLLGSVNLLMIPAAGYVIVKRRQNG